MMVTAQDIRDQLAKIALCDGIDDWINAKLRPQFLRKGVGGSVTLDQREVRWPSQHFEIAMVNRGFNVQLICPDRPGQNPYFVINL